MCEEQQTLKWGDIVRIHGVNLSKKDLSKGLLLSKGYLISLHRFTDSNIYYQKYDNFSDVNFYCQTLFQILPRFVFDVHDQLLQEGISLQQRELLRNRAKGQLQGLYNTLKVKATAREQIQYGSEVIFRHVKSNSYLRGQLTAADSGGDGAFKVQVTENLSSKVIFKLLSHRSYQYEGDKIYYNDCLLIYHQYADCFMNYAENDKPVYLDTPYEVAQIDEKNQSYKYVMNRPHIKQPNNKRISVINQNKSKCLWQFVQNCTYESFMCKNKIKAHDIVYFQHTKNQGMISCSLQRRQFFMKENCRSYQCFWQLIPNQNINKEDNNSDVGFWAQNIITGVKLEFKGFEVQVRSKDENDNKGFINGSLVNLICTPQNKLLERGNQIINDKLPKIVQYAEQKWSKISLCSVDKLNQDSFCIFKVDDDLMMNINYIISSHQHLIKFVQIMLTQLIKKQQQNYSFKHMFLLLPQTALSQIICILKMLIGKIYNTTYEQVALSGNTADRTIQKILIQTGVTEILIEIIYLLYEPIKYIQKIEPEQDRAIRNKIGNIFMYSYKLLEKIVVGYDENRIYMSRWVDLFLQHSNNINKSYIQQCLVGILQNNPLSIQTTIDQDKINYLIKSFFQQAKQSKSGDNILTTKYLRLFSTFIKCQNRVIKCNQQIILNNFFKNIDNFLSFKFKVQDKQDQIEDVNDLYSKIKIKRIQIALGKQDFTSIPKFYKDWRAKWDYFLAYSNLLADICMDRNHQSIENVSALISLQIVTTILLDPQLTALNDEIRKQALLNSNKMEQSSKILDVHQPFVRIAHYVYICNEKFTPIKRIKNISLWNRDKDEKNNQISIRNEQIKRSKRRFEGEKQQEQKYYLMSILRYIENFISNCDQDRLNLNILYTILNLTQETVILGLWENIQQFRKLIPLLIMRITKIENSKFFDVDEETKQRYTSIQYVNMNKQNLKLNRPQISRVIECKIKAIEIFKLMNQMEIDIRLRYVMNFFKGLYQATQQFPQKEEQKNQQQNGIKDEESKKRDQIAKDYLFNNDLCLLGKVQKVSDDEDIMQKQHLWLNKIKQLTPNKFQFVDENDPSRNRYLFQGDRRNIDPSISEDQRFSSMILAVIQLPIYQNKKLLNSSLIMLQNIFEQRKELTNKFQSMLICGGGNLLELYTALKCMRMKFQMLANINILKYNGYNDESFQFPIWKTYDSEIKNQASRSGILQDLFFLARTLKQGTNMKKIEALMNITEKQFDMNTVYSHFTEKDINNRLFQTVNVAEGIYLPLINYIQIINSNNITELHRRILFSIYQYFTILCYNNMQAKQILMHYIPSMLLHLKLKVGAAKFLYEVAVGNKLLINNEELVKQMIDAALQACIGMDKTILKTHIVHRDYEKSMILSSLRGILLYNDEGHQRNQQMVINRLQDNKYKRLIYKSNTEFINRRDNFNLMPEQAYIASHFQLFSAMVQSKNFINIGKLQNIHPYSYCLQCLKNTNRWQIRRVIRCYINRLYYVNKDRDVFLFQEFIRKQFKIINDELYDVIQLHRGKLIDDEIQISNAIRFHFALSQVHILIIQIMITLHQMFLKTEFVRVLLRQINKEQKKPDNQRQIHDQLIKLLQNIGCLNLIYPKVKPICSFIKQVFNLLENNILIKIQRKYLQSRVSNDTEILVEEHDDLGGEIQKKNYVYDHSKSFFRNLNSMIREIKSQEQRKKIKEEMCLLMSSNLSEDRVKKNFIQSIFSVRGQTIKPLVSKKYRQVATSQYNPHILTSHSKLFKVAVKTALGQNEENIDLNHRLTVIKSIINDRPAFKKLKEDQFYNLVEILTNINETSSHFYRQQWMKIGEKKPIPVISLKQIIKNSFELIMHNSQEVADQQKIFIIKLARCYITEAVEHQQNYKLPVDKWDSDYYEDSQKDSDGLTEFIRRQNIIQECLGSDFILSIFKENLCFRTELLNQILLLGIAYLYNGNTNCQDSLHRALRKDTTNSMLISIQSLIQYIGNFLIELRKMGNEGEKPRSFAYKITDTYDFFDEKEGTITKGFVHAKSDRIEEYTEKNYELGLCRIFRFLQLFCENNNVQMKKFLLIQTNQDDQKKSNCINFIQQSTLLLRKLFKVMVKPLVSIPPFLLDFISEITQLPCLQNQISLMKSTFFQDISYLADFFENFQNLNGRNFIWSGKQYDPLSQLREIYQKGIDLALCNFQGNDNLLLWQFISKCQPKFLWIVMKQNILTIIAQKADQYGCMKTSEDIIDVQFEKNLLVAFNKHKIRELIQSQKCASEQYREEICNILGVICILKKIHHYASDRMKAAFKDKENPNFQEKQKADKATQFRQRLITEVKQVYPSIEKFLILFEQLILEIEISSNNGVVDGFQYIHFPNHPVFNYLAGDTKDSIMMLVTRDTQRDKLISLLGFNEQVQSEISWNYRSKFQNLNIIGMNFENIYTFEFCNNVRKSARYVSFLICFLMAIFIMVDHDQEEQTSVFTYTDFFTEWFIKITCKFQLALTLGFLYIWLKLRQPLAIMKYDRDHEEPPDIQVPIINEEKKQNQTEKQGWDILITAIITLWKYSAKKLNFCVRALTKNYYFKNIFLTVLALHKYQSGFLSILIFILASILGNFVGVQWYTIHIFDIFVNIPQLTNIFKAILQNIQKLTILSLLAGAFILVFNVLSLSTYTPVIYSDDLPKDACEQIVNCVLTLYTSGAIGDDMDELQTGRFIFDIIYVVFMELLFQNIVGGIVIDGLAGLKEEDETRDQDKKNFCYICSMSKANMQKSGTTFKTHTQKHFLWNYIFYLYFLKQKNPTDFTGLQYYINEKIKNQDVTWFPVIDEASGGQIQIVMSQLKQNMDTVLSSVNSLVTLQIDTVTTANRSVRRILDSNRKIIDA